MLETLASYGADVNERLSVQSICNEPKELLASQSPLNFAVAKGQVAVVAWLLKHEADPDSPNICGQTPQGCAQSKELIYVARARYERLTG